MNIETNEDDWKVKPALKFMTILYNTTKPISIEEMMQITGLTKTEVLKEFAFVQKKFNAKLNIEAGGFQPIEAEKRPEMHKHKETFFPKLPDFTRARHLNSILHRNHLKK